MTHEVILIDEVWEGVEAGSEALLDEWHVGAGDTVSQGQHIATVMLIKTSHEIEAPADGVVTSILVAAEENFVRGQALAVIE